MQLGRALLLDLDTYTERALETFSGLGDGLGSLTLEDLVVRGMADLEFTCGDLRRGDDFKIGYRNKVPDLEFTLADDRQRRRFHAPDTDDTSSALSQDHGRGAGEREIINLVGLPACDGGSVQAGIFGIGFGVAEGIADGVGILRGEKHPHDLAAVVVVLENLLTDQLAFAIAVGGQPDPLGGA